MTIAIQESYIKYLRAFRI